MIRPARVHIDLTALRKNLSIARQLAGETKLMAVIKADAYGHGMLEVAQALTDADAFAVASVGEGEQLRSSGITHPILVLQGTHHSSQLKQAVASELTLCIHQSGQVEDLKKYQGQWPTVWLKLDTGMGRLGFPPNDLDALLNTLGNNCESIMMQRRHQGTAPTRRSSSCSATSPGNGPWARNLIRCSPIEVKQGKMRYWRGIRSRVRPAAAAGTSSHLSRRSGSAVKCHLESSPGLKGRPSTVMLMP